MEIRCEHCDKFTRHDAIDSLLEQRAALRAERDTLRAELAAAKAERDALAAHIERLREALEDSDKRLCNHHNIEHIQQAYRAGLGAVCEICHEEPQVFKRNADVLFSTPAQSLAAHDAALLREVAERKAWSMDGGRTWMTSKDELLAEADRIEKEGE